MRAREGESRSGGRRGRERSRAAISSNGKRNRGEISRGGTSTSSGNNGRLSLAKEPLDGLAVGFMTKLSSQLKYSGGADDGHTDAAATAVDFTVTVLRRGFFDDEGSVRRGLILVGFDGGGIGDAIGVGGMIGI